VVAPEGVILARSGGAWRAAPVPRPAGFADWTHFDGGPDGNALSADREATAIRTVQWFENARPARWAKRGPAGGDGGNIRVWGRFAVIDIHVDNGTNQKGVVDEDHPFLRRAVLECRDVNNGMLIWRKPRQKNTENKRWATAVGHGRCYTWLDYDQPLAAIDLASGAVRERFPGSEMRQYLGTDGPPDKPKVTPRRGMRSEKYWVRVGERTVVANGDDALRAWSLDGTPLWTFTRAGASVELPALDEARGMVYAMLVEEDKAPRFRQDPIQFMRWPTSERVLGFVAIDLKTGAVRWENTDLASRKTDIVHGKTGPVTIGWGQVIVAGPHVVVMNTDAISGGGAVLVGAMDAATGHTVHFDPMLFATGTRDKARFDGGLRNVAYRDGIIHVLSSAGYYLYDPVKGTQQLVNTLSWNARCVRPVLAPEHVLIGHTAFIGRDHSGFMYSSARSGCAMSPVPGAGLILFGPHMCGCVSHLDGHFATSSRPAGAPLPDDQRRVGEPPTGVPVPAAAAPGKAIAESPATENWRWFTITGPVVPATTERDGWRFRVDPSAHRIDAQGPGGAAWAYIAEARIGTSIVVTADRVVLGSHDGWVHGLDRATGALAWKHLLAPSHRLIVANTMLTSTWPVFGVADLGSGVVVASAGIHVEHDGGIRVAGLRAADGTVVWHKSLRKPPSVITSGEGRKRIIERSVINTTPRVVDGKVVIKGIEYHMGGVEFTPDEDEAAINTRLDTPAKR
jgi:outer membrane protein assembly factor BamB